MMKKRLCALAVLATTSLPVLAADVDVNVKGTIEPTACALTLPASANIDYGVIDPTTLNGTNYTLLAEKEIDISLSCDSPVKMGLMAVNNRPATMAGVTEGPSGAGTAPVNLFGATNQDGAGLGLDGSDKIGGYGVRLKQGSVTADGAAVDVIVKGAAASTWIKSASGVLYNRTERQHLSWAKTGTVIPIAFENMAGKIAAQAYINKKSELDLSKPVVLDGLTTLELVYL